MSAKIKVEELEAYVPWYSEKTVSISIGGVGGGYVGETIRVWQPPLTAYFNINIAAIKIFHQPPPRTPRPYPMAEGREKILVEAGILSSTHAPSPNQKQYASYSAFQTSAGVLPNLSEAIFGLRVKATDKNGVYARVVCFVHFI